MMMMIDSEGDDVDVMWCWTMFKNKSQPDKPGKKLEQAATTTTNYNYNYDYKNKQ